MERLEALIAVIKRLAASVRRNNVAIHSAEAAFFVVIAFLPTMMLLLMLINLLPFTEEQIQLFSVDFLSPQVSGLVSGLLDEIRHKSSGAVISTATVAALWSASRGLLSIIKGLNSIYGVEERRGYIKIRLITMLYMLAFMATLIITLLLLVFGGAIAEWLTDAFPALEVMSVFFSYTRWLFGLCILILFFWAFYSFAPGRKTVTIKEFPGAILAALGWVGFSALYSFYINNFANYSYLYGSLTAIVLLMLWLYFCMNILFFGAEVNVFLKDVFSKRRLIKGKIRKESAKV